MDSVPVARALFLCDAVQADAATGNVTLVNCFNRLVATAFPCTNRPFSVVAFLSDGFGGYRVGVQITHLESGRTVYDHRHTLSFPDRLYEIRYRLQVTGCVFPEPGVYEVQMLVGREVVADTRFLLRPPEANHG